MVQMRKIAENEARDTDTKVVTERKPSASRSLLMTMPERPVRSDWLISSRLSPRQDRASMPVITTRRRFAPVCSMRSSSA